MQMPRVLGFVLAGGKGERLFPLTQERTKPAIPFGGKYRIIDFVLSNFLNSGIYSIYVLVQYMSQSLIQHLRAGWRISGRIKDHFITVAPPQMRWGDVWFRGTADAVFQNLNLIQDMNPTHVVIFGGDHIYRMDITQMMHSHIERGADVTVAALPVSREEAKGFGVIEVDREDRIIGFQEKPERPKGMPSDPCSVYASMGNYIFNKDLLVDVLIEDASRSTAHDFGKTIVPELVPRARVYAYNLLQNAIPGLKPYEERGYWRDVGTIFTYWKAHMDLLGPTPTFDLGNPLWPILTEAFEGPPARVLRGEIEDSFISEGSLIEGATVKRSTIGRGVRVEEGAFIEESILMDFVEVGKGSRLRRVIVDRFNRIQPGDQIGYDPERDRKRYTVDHSGIVVIPRQRGSRGRHSEGEDG